MQTGPFIDHTQIAQTICAAKLGRARHLSQQSRDAKVVRWCGLAAVVAVCLAMFASHGPSVDQAQAGEGAKYGVSSHF